MSTQPQFTQRQIQQLQELDKLQKVEMAKVLEDNFFPAELIPHGFIFWLRKAIDHEKPRTLECEWPILRGLQMRIIESSSTFNLQQFGFACNAIEDKTPLQLGFSLEDYVIIQDAIQDLATKWKAIIDELNAPVIEKYKVLVGRVKDNKPIIMPNQPQIIT